MQRIGRIAVLGIVLVLLLWGSNAVLPGLVDATDEDFRDDCQYTYLVFEVEDPTSDERASAIPYENLSEKRRTVFDAYLGTEDGATELDSRLWNDLYEQPESTHYVEYEGALYRARPVLQRCSTWERYGNGTIP